MRRLAVALLAALHAPLVAACAQDAGAVRASGAAAGEALVARGRLAEAESTFVRARAAGGPDSLRAIVELARLRWRAGRTDDAMRLADHVADVYASSRGRLTASELLAVADACRLLGIREPQLYKDALQVYVEAAALAPKDPEPHVRAGEMFLEKFNSAEAERAFGDALALDARHPRALLGAAARREFDGAPGADSLLDLALQADPALVPALVMKSEALLVADQVAEAIAMAEKALAIDPTSPEALAALAGARFVSGDERGAAEVERRARAGTPDGAAMLASLAEIVARHRRYDAAAAIARRAIAMDSTAWRAHARLGTNLLRLGDVPAARAALERAFAGDPYDVWTKNTLDLLDTYKDYDEVEAGRFRVLVGKKEGALLAPFVRELGDEAWTTFARRYGWQPAGPVRVELYRSHEDFSVRSVGLTGLGALGVAFGDVLAMDSPAARERGEFNWGATFWHELAHTFTLGASGGRVPRWLSEGLSVYEEWKARPGWGFDVTPSFLAAFADGRLQPVSRLNEGFSRPRFAEQVQLSYVQAALVALMLEEQHGDGVFRKLLDAYRRGRATPDAFREATGAPFEALDAKFDAWLRARYAGPLAAVGRGGRGELARTLREGTILVQQGKLDEAVTTLEKAKRLFPDYVGPEDPRWLLAGIHLKQGDRARAAEELKAIVARDDRHWEAHAQLAGLLEQAGDRAGAARAIEGALWIWPYDRTLHERLAALLEEPDPSAGSGQAARLVRQRRAVLALEPADRAEAHYQLARALRAAGDAAEARREVLRALEIAPNFEKAQGLLLELRGGGR